MNGDTPPDSSSNGLNGLSPPQNETQRTRPEYEHPQPSKKTEAELIASVARFQRDLERRRAAQAQADAATSNGSTNGPVQPGPSNGPSKHDEPTTKAIPQAHS